MATMTRSASLLIIGTGTLSAVLLTAMFAQETAVINPGLKKAPAPEPVLGYTDTPMLPNLPWRVHDINRPHSRVVDPGSMPGAPPSDAIVLFDGKDLSHWTKGQTHIASTTPYHSDQPPGWKVENGYVEVVRGAGDIATKETFGDCQLHVEWATPADAAGASQSRGNSGVFLQARYEMEMLDSYQNPTYADGQAASIYGQYPPLVNACRKPGEWQTYDIFFEAPRFNDGKLARPAYVTILYNGVLVQNHQRIIGPTMHRQTQPYSLQPAEDVIVLQNHTNPDRFRNIWVRRLERDPERE